MGKKWVSQPITMLLLSSVFVGCATQSNEMNTHQAAIGLGIVEGTKGYQQIQREQYGLGSKITGQVVRIEGAAYVVHMLNNDQIRLPFDEETRIDRPAHVGDWIAASINQDGRAQFIQNIDDQIGIE